MDPGSRLLTFLFFFLVSAVLSSDVGVNLCCSDGEMLRIKERDSFSILEPVTAAECIPAGVSNLEQEFVKVVDHSRNEKEGRLVRRKLRKTGDFNLECNDAVVVNSLDLDSKGQSEPTQRRSYDLRLEGSSNSHEGNVILNEKPVCDDSWDDKAAMVTCSMLGYRHGKATKESRYGDQGQDYVLDDVQCQGYEAHLFDCFHRQVHNCGFDEAAGVICSGPLGSSNSTLTVDGDLINEKGERLEAGSFCVAHDYRMEGGGIMAVHCANNKVIPTFAKTFWGSLLRFNPGRDLTDETGLGGVFIPDEEYEMERNFVAMADQDNSKTLDIQEFEHFTNSNIIEPIFELLDETGDGVIEAAIEGKPFENISFRMLDIILKKIFIFLDFSKDDVLSIKDDLNSRNEHGSSLEESFGEPPIMWPHPVYKFYTTLDVDQNEELTLDEAKNFLEKTFTALDSNEDCKISTEEIQALVISLGMSESYRLTVQCILNRFLKMANFIITETVMLADTDGDEKTTFQEIWDFADWKFVDEILLAAGHIGYPPWGAMYYILGMNLFDRRGRRHHDETMVKLMEALLNLMEHPAYTSPARGVCGILV